ncbi:hypothetical protein HY78_00380 [Rhizorhabdus wittichii DC-6]|nr:hypothetical protein HY78_00380 [Rhizorhabdus wittichii DC-6]
MTAFFRIELSEAQRRTAQRLLLIGILEAAEQRHWLDDDGNCRKIHRPDVLNMLVGAQKASEALGITLDLVPRSFLSIAAGFDPIELIRYTLANFTSNMAAHDRMVSHG